MQRKNFTLIEMIVVVAIIAILASLLLPALSKAMQRGRAITCTSNLKQIGISFQIYTDDFDGYAVPLMMEAPVEHWLNFFYVHLSEQNAKILQCPQVDNQHYFNPYGGDGNYAKLLDASYIMNAIAPGNNGSHWTGSTELSEPVGSSYGWSANGSNFLKATAVRKPDQAIYIVDSPNLQFSSPTSSIGIQRFDQTDHGIIDQNTNNMVNSSLNGSTSDRKVGHHHMSGFNSLFGDYHVEFIQSSYDDMWFVHSD
ncbi:MAG: type II secretion system protein [Lentisphaeria bacterium]|nr:type II secretion system GspH family protein [Lentisphaeria bacterium]NQZ71040.1 type II secretion system protein [Lentisphaeria bacterium]